MRRCHRCKQLLPLTAFGKRSGGRLYRSACHACEGISSKEWRTKNPERVRYHNRAITLRRSGGITIEQYEQAWFAQRGCCAICGTTPREAAA